MKIAVICSTFPPYSGGMGNVAYYNAWYLATQGHQVTVFTPIYKRLKNVRDEYPFKVVRLYPWFKYGNSGFLPQLLWKLWGFDIIHLHYPFFGGAEIVYFLDKIKDIKLIITYHMDVVGSGVLASFFHWHTEHVLPRIIDRADKVLVTSWDYAKSSALKNWIEAEPEKFVEVSIGVNHLLFKPRFKDKPLMELYDLYGKNVILFVGALDRAHYFKGVNILIQAIFKLNDNDDFRVLIVGGGDMQDSYQSLAENLGLSKKIIFVGRVDDQKLLKFYSVANMLVLPSIDRSEAFGIVALEAMACGVPVIASDLAGVRSVVIKKETGLLVKPGSVENLTNMIRILLKNSKLARTLGQEGRQRVLANYTWEIVGKKLNDIMNNLQ
jgi:glycosyltransferase involved in cell wall biosynthesis